MELSTSFFDPALLETEYFRRHRDAYAKYFVEGLIPKYRCYPIFIDALQTVFSYNARHGLSFSGRLKNQWRDLRACDGIIAEVIVYAHYATLVDRGTIRSLDIRKDDYDLKIERANGSEAFLEILSVNPEFRKTPTGCYEVMSHKQEGPASIRQKLLKKMRLQKQMQKARENWAVIELNNVTIAGDFAVRSSLSSGYKLQFNRDSMEVEQRGYDWNWSIFDEPETRHLHGVIHFDLGLYEDRRYILNERVRGEGEKPDVP